MKILKYIVCGWLYITSLFVIVGGAILLNYWGDNRNIEIGTVILAMPWISKAVTIFHNMILKEEEK